MGGAGNLEPGSKVPTSGIYKCVWCGTFVSAGSKIRTPTTRFYRAGKTFKTCPICKDSTGWTLIEDRQTNPEWWKFWR